MAIRSSLFVLLLLALAMPLAAQVPIADFSAHGPAFGTHNLTRSASAPIGGGPTLLQAELWADQVEDANTVVTIWLRFDITANAANPALIDITFVPMFSSLDKITGTVTQPIDARTGGGGLATTAAGLGNFNIFQWELFRPRLAFTSAPASGGVDAMVAAYGQIDPVTGNRTDCFASFLGYNSGTGEWEINPNRAEFNVSNSTGNSADAAVVGLDNGDIIFAWSDPTTAGNIGDVAGITPMVTFPAASGAVDVYARSTTQRFPAIPGPGAEDPNMTTINLSQSGGFDNGVTAATDGMNNVWVSWQTTGVEAEMVGGANGAGGPVGSMQGAETDDVYLSSLDITLGTFALDDVVNVSQSQGAGSVAGPEVAYNPSLDQLAVKYLDDTSTGGVGGVPGLNATPGGPAGTESDLFVSLYSTGLLFITSNNISVDANDARYGTIVPFGPAGWLVGWSYFDAALQVTGIQHRSLNGAAQYSSDLQSYPINGTLGAGFDILFTMSSIPNSTVSIGFLHDGTPDNLRTGYMGVAMNDTDMFLAHGEISNSQNQGGLEIVNFTVNNGLPIDLNGLPPAIPVDISIANTHATEQLTVNQINVNEPAAGFTRLTNLVPQLPIDLQPGEISAFVMTFSVQPATLVLGTNVFFASAVGTLSPSGVNVGDNSLATIPVVGQSGNLTGVTVTVALGRNAIPSGTASQFIMTVTLENQGPDPLTNIVFGGSMDPGLSTANGSTDFFSAVWTPVPGQTSVAVGSRRDFRVSLLVAPDMPAGTYSPAVVVQMQQGLDALGNPIMGTITQAATVPLEITSPFTAGPNDQPVPVSGFGLGNGKGTNSGCALASTGSDSAWAWFALLFASLSVLALRRTRRLS